MAIFGDLNHMTLGDLLPLLGAQDGAMEIFNLDEHACVTLYFRSGKLQCLHVGSRPADPLVARSTVSRLVSAKRGSFEFVPGAQAHRCPQPLGWPLDKLLLASVAVQDEINELERRLPHPQTIFRRVRYHEPEDDRLTEFLRRAGDLLDVGASAADIAHRLQIPLDHTQYYLHKLRQLGLLEPVRAQAKRSNRLVAAANLLTSLKHRFFGERQAWNH